MLQTLFIGTEANFWERDWLQWLLGGRVLRPTPPERYRADIPTLIVLTDVDGRHRSQTAALLEQARAARTPVYLIHLSDEFLACPIDFYAMATVVFRNYYRPDAVADGRVIHFPLGYKSGFDDNLRTKPVDRRAYRWFFAGQVKGGRTKMLEAARRVPGGRAVLTNQWDDPAGLGTQDYAAALGDAVFAPCPRGNDSVDCFRVWEALEAGAIPVVEDDGRFDDWLRRARVPMRVREPFAPRGRWTCRYRAWFGRSYWLSSYGPDFPLPKVHSWSDLPKIMANKDAVALAAKAGAWWNDLKQASRAAFASRVPLEALPVGSFSDHRAQD